MTDFTKIVLTNFDTVKIAQRHLIENLKRNDLYVVKVETEYVGNGSYQWVAWTMPVAPPPAATGAESSVIMNETDGNPTTVNLIEIGAAK